MAEPKTCTTCVHRFMLDDPKYARCRQSGEPERADASLAGELRKAGGKCGPDAALWEAVT